MTCTPTSRPDRKHIALGLDRTLGAFFANSYIALRPQNIEVYVWGQWKAAGLSDVYPGSGAAFILGFEQASTRAERIHFNLEGIGGNINDYAQEFGSHGLTGDAYYAAYELYTIKTRGLCAKTDFYENGSQSLSPSPRRQQLCGGQ